MTSQAKGFQLSLGIHGVLILLVTLLQSLAVSQTKVTVIDFTLSGNTAPPAVEQTSPYQAPAAKQEPKPAKAIRPKEIPKQEITKKAIVKEVVAEQPTRQSEAEKAQSPAEVSSTTEEVPPPPSQAVEGPDGSSGEEKGNSIPSPRGDDGVGAPSANGASRDAADTDGSTQGATGSSGNADAGATPEVSRATYLKQHFAYIRDRITGSISYPHVARKMGWCGRVKIAFVVCEDGGVNDVRVVESSGFSLLDRNAVETVKHVAPFPNPPVKAEIRMAITYRLQ